jgi:hypothetical protein
MSSDDVTGKFTNGKRLDHMSGPIVRTGTTPEFWKNWDQAFGGKASAGAGKKKASGGEPKATKPVAAKKAAKKAARKTAASKTAAKKTAAKKK